MYSTVQYYELKIKQTLWRHSWDNVENWRLLEEYLKDDQQMLKDDQQLLKDDQQLFEGRSLLRRIADGRSAAVWRTITDQQPFEGRPADACRTISSS